MCPGCFKALAGTPSIGKSFSLSDLCTSKSAKLIVGRTFNGKVSEEQLAAWAGSLGV